MATERRFRPRKQMKFWCYTDLKTDAWLIEIITYWKAKKQFADMVKNGLRLMWSLGQGHLDVLFELFPQIESQLAAKYTPPPTPDNTNLERQIADLKSIILAQGGIGAPPPNYPSMKPALAPPTVQAKAAAPASADDIASNFLNFIQ